MAWGPLSGSSSQVIVSAVDPFSPDQISDLEAWYTMSVIGNLFQNTDFTNPVTANSDPIGSIRDNTDNDVDLSRGGSSGTEPTYETAGINSNPAAAFDGGDWWKAQSNTPISFNQDDPFTCFAVYRTPASLSVDAIMMKGDGSVQWNFAIGNPSAGIMNLNLISSSGLIVAYGSTAFATSTTYAMAATYNGNTIGSGVKLHLNNSEETMNFGIGQEGPLLATIDGNGPFLVGFDLYSKADGLLGEALVYSKVLSAEELTDLYNHFKTTYGYA